MQQALPEDLWFFIILLALLILAYLWNDKAGSSGKKRKRTTTDPDPEPEPTTDPDPGPEPGPGGGERPPEIHAHIHSHSRFSEEVGDEFAVKATFDPGDGDVQEKRVEINGREVNIAEQGDGIFVSEPVRVVEGENVGEVSIKTTAGEDMDRTGFEASEGGDGGDGREDPSVRAGYEIIDEQKGHVRIEATSIPGSLPIEKTIINISSRGENVGGNVDESENCVFESKGLPHGNYIITAIAQDVEGNTGQYTEPFTLKMPGAGPSVPGGGLPGGIFNPQIEVSPEININTESSGGSTRTTDPEDYDGDRWEVYFQILKESNMPDEILKEFLFIFKSRNDVENIVDRLSINQMLISRLIDLLTNVRESQVPEVGFTIVSIIDNQNLDSLNNTIMNNIVETIQANFTILTKFKNDPTPKGSMGTDLGFDKLVEHIEEEAELEEEISKLDKDAVQELRKVQEWYRQNQAWITKIDEVTETNNLESMSPAKVSDLVRQINARTKSDIDLSDHEMVTERREEAERMISHLDRALNDLREARGDTVELEHDEERVGEALNKIEDRFREEIKVAMQVLNKRGGTGSRNREE